MKRILALALVVLACTTRDSTAQDDTKLRAAVAAAIEAEVESFDELEERWKKKKLKPAETASLFGKKKLTTPQQTERMQDIREQVLAGEASFRVLSLKSDDLVTGKAGAWPEGAKDVRCEYLVESRGGFVGTYKSVFATSGVVGTVGNQKLKTTTRSSTSQPFLFAGIPGSEDLVDDKTISITCPVIVTGRFSDGSQTMWRIESLASCIKRLREADQKKKAKAAMKE